MSDENDNEKNFDTGVFRRLIHTEINEALGNLEMKSRAMQFNALTADLIHMAQRVTSYEAALREIAGLLEVARDAALRAIDERTDDQIMADIALLLERMADTLKALGVGDNE